jgi:hypothetical protein
MECRVKPGPDRKSCRGVPVVLQPKRQRNNAEAEQTYRAAVTCADFLNTRSGLDSAFAIGWR